MKTAMQELIEELYDYKRTTFSDKLVITFWIIKAEKLLEKEKEHIRSAYNKGRLNEMDKINISSKEYYDQTYNQK